MYRKDGVIPTITGEKLPTRILIFDTEAYRSEPIDGVEFQSLRLGVCHFMQLEKGVNIVRDEWFNFTSGDELTGYIDFQTRKDKSLYVYAHNLKYDLQLSGLLTGLIGLGYRPGLFVIEDPPTFMRLTRGRKSIILVDTFNYWQYSLSKMGLQLSHEKLTMPSENAPINEWFTYCKRDVEVLGEYLLSFISFLIENDLAGIGLTLASQAFRTYRHKFMMQEIILHNRPEVLTLERSGYYGGRTDAFFIGHGPIQDYYKVDVNSMYPFVMKNNTYPVELIGYSEDIPVKRLDDLLENYYCLAQVEIDTKTPLYPFVQGQKLLFPTGIFETVIHHSEIIKAYRAGEITAIRKIAIYNRGDIFSSYVDFFYNLKIQSEIEGNQVLRQQSKIFLNALYGKFGQREIVSKITPYTGPERYDRLTGYSVELGQSVEVNYLGNAIEVRYKGGESYYSSPVIAGSVTSNARVYLWELITAAGVENCYYVDTDSIILNRAGYDRLAGYLDPVKLGSLKLEGVENHLLIKSVKDYEFGKEIKIKGVPKSAKLLSPDKWEYQQFRGGKTWLKEGLPVGVEVYTRTKERKTAYNKGLVLLDGRVIPFEFGRGH